MVKKVIQWQPLPQRVVRRVLPLIVLLVVVACHDQEEKVEVRRADAQRAATTAMSHVADRASSFGYQTQTEGLGENGPVVHVIDVIPSYRLDAFGGQLMGDDRGEFGGELMFRDQQGSTRLLMKRNVHGIFQMPFGVVVFTGLAHMRSKVGGTYLVTASPGSIPVVAPFRALQGAPEEVVRTLSGELVFKVLNGRFERDGTGEKLEAKDCYLMKKSGEIKKLSCASIVIVN
ncbi:hypothetical protein [Rhodanobacter sp. MP7CTX1]|uniref:hypothetical protein n=1 Tax=Rhodanobacter sp. MP7CTX1 TaxID=2723084 RepID=UPI001619270F|nr:hypothetical protein [Rhodanobacter sp. MP7CTX1]MBB6187686.1 hypothetical protein [Rhodanobacter sp. MP7CTX1]